MKLPCHRQFRFVLLLHRPLQLPGQHALYGGCVNFPPNAFFFEKAFEGRSGAGMFSLSELMQFDWDVAIGFLPPFRSGPIPRPRCN